MQTCLSPFVCPANICPANRYGWGKDAPRLDLPQGVGFSVGKGSAVRWVVAQVHYLNEKPANEKAGVRLT
jgi:hypothetical protein